eukprot:530823-Pyramimonas_sp.AAC.1
MSSINRAVPSEDLDGEPILEPRSSATKVPNVLIEAAQVDQDGPALKPNFLAEAPQEIVDPASSLT